MKKLNFLSSLFIAALLLIIIEPSYAQTTGNRKTSIKKSLVSDRNLEIKKPDINNAKYKADKEYVNRLFVLSNGEIMFAKDKFLLVKKTSDLKGLNKKLLISDGTDKYILKGSDERLFRIFNTYRTPINTYDSTIIGAYLSCCDNAKPAPCTHGCPPNQTTSVPPCGCINNKYCMCYLCIEMACLEDTPIN